MQIVPRWRDQHHNVQIHDAGHLQHAQLMTTWELLVQDLPTVPTITAFFSAQPRIMALPLITMDQ